MSFAKNTDILPESPVYVGDRTAEEMDASIIIYDAAAVEIKKLSNIEELLQYKDKSKTYWINISGLKDVEAIKRLGLLYMLHPLTIEDILNTEQQPKIEIFEEYRFLSLKTIQHEKSFHYNIDKNKDKNIEEFLIDQVSIIIMKGVLITIQEIPGDSFDGVRNRILYGAGGIRKMGTDYLAYTIIDAVVDEYFLALNHLEDDIEQFEERAAKTSDGKFIEEIQDTKKYLLQIKRAVSPLKDNMTAIAREKVFGQTELKPFLQDLNENLTNAIATIENYREWLSNIMDVNLSVVTYQMNKVMKVLAVISTIFIPLTFIAGVYGMNFEYMPELKYTFGYPAVLGGMGLIALVMIIIFKIRRWF
ncbi:MAG: magnesium/cobalt transporter CorA [Spirochaetaceae bacterium]|jgi:magnesium transporter|nr:magnesium/cobalt transporter CorA [Spirochaetaceae bacterium]